MAIWLRMLIQRSGDYRPVAPQELEPQSLIAIRSEVVLPVRKACNYIQLLRKGVMTRRLEDMLEENSTQEHRIMITIDKQELSDEMPLLERLEKVYQNMDWALTAFEKGVLDEARAPCHSLNFMCPAHRRTLPPTDQEFIDAIMISRTSLQVLRRATEEGPRMVDKLNVYSRLQRLLDKMVDREAD
ncbi:hypothetical protein NEOLEDRAFT_908512 [Neolentinus lepideus HHB14362 ss-1]|uniref:Uncharacterized protein n=1 Tax=Neolentinus lepideus HHB14362 ss-1 TaxID=1314782 RepID=A0A165UJL2_9AGAM|nr:hypothetical protein NEOLEDRAFT_908512 [Neolentinus lepideus HHB14362 ss-1]